jgi:alpha-galactosidase
MLRLPGLDADRSYRVEVVELPPQGRSMARRQPDWLVAGIVLTGRQLAGHGLQLPSMNPESAVLLHLAIQEVDS